MPTSSGVLIDDRLLVAELTGSAWARPRRARLHTTSYWYYRACRAAVLGSGGQLSGPFEQLPEARRGEVVAAMLHLPDDIGLADPRLVIPVMVEVAGRHPRLNLLNVEAVAAAKVWGYPVLLSPASAAGVLPDVLDAEGLAWRRHDPAQV